ncbi:MAG: aldehyde dehydrogenase family protein, partial [Pyramidobacter sp.]|nr:aldehyde dehydrogenase family protein [Pyramidobacter sp.]
MDVSLILTEMGQKARRAAYDLALASSDIKNKALRAMAAELRAHASEIIEANRFDVTEAENDGLSKAMIQRLTLDEKQIEGMAKGIEEVAALPDPIGRTVSGHISPEGLEITQVRVPLGVIGVIYESRPNVTADTAALCLKSGNAVILRGGSEAVNSNRIIAKVLTEAALSVGLPDG